MSDDWGRDDRAVRRLWLTSRLRWEVSVGGQQHVPRRTGALIVVNARRWSLAPVFAALSIGAAVDRPVRFVGRPDVAPLGPAMQRLGALLPIPDEVGGALQARELVVLGAEHTASNAHAGTIDHRFVGAALAAGVRVLPAATVSAPLGRQARVEIGERVRPPRRRRGPLDELELSDRLRLQIDSMLGVL